MAIGFAHASIVHASSDRGVVEVSARLSGEDRENRSVGRVARFPSHFQKPAHVEVLLPEGAPDRFRDGAVLWNEALECETTIDEKSRKRRFKIRAQVAKHLFLALPKELGLADHVEMVRRFARENYTGHGVAVEAAVRELDDNPHAQLLISTRIVTENGFGLKARHLDPRFAFSASKGKGRVSKESGLNSMWRAFQNAFFEERGLELRVDALRGEFRRNRREIWQ